MFKSGMICLISFFFLISISPSAGITMKLEKNKQLCVGKELNYSEKFIGNYVVSGYEEDSISVSIQETNPSKQIHQMSSLKEGKWNITALKDGEFKACFRNTGQHDAYISLDIQVESPIDREELKLIEETEASAELMRSLIEATRAVNQVRTNQGFQKTRGAIHTLNLEHLDSQIHWSALFKIAVLISIASAQVYILTGYFKKQRRFVV